MSGERGAAAETKYVHRSKPKASLIFLKTIEEAIEYPQVFVSILK